MAVIKKQLSSRTKRKTIYCHHWKAVEKNSRRVQHIFYVMDTSASTQGETISALNRAMEKTVEALKDEAKGNLDAEFKIAVLEFSSGCKWMESQIPERVEDFVWKPLTVGGMTDVGCALKELNSKMSRDAFLKTTAGCYLPLIIFMTDGSSTDDYKKPLEEIRKNMWFSRAVKIGFAIGDNPDVDMVADIAGSDEAVVKSSDLSVFVKMLKFFSIWFFKGFTKEGCETRANACIRSAIEDGIIQKNDIAIGTGTVSETPIFSIDNNVDDEWFD